MCARPLSWVCLLLLLPLTACVSSINTNPSAGGVTAPVMGSAKGFGIAGRAGTLGVGGEVALGLTDAFVIRGGLGFIPFEPTTTIDDIEFTLKLPEKWMTIGADIYLGDSFRIGGGMLFKSVDPSLTGSIVADSVGIGDMTYTSTEVSQLTAVLDSKDQAPYILIGFGRHTASGIGLFLDLGAAFIGEPEVRLDATGNSTIIGSSEFQSELRKQEANIEGDLGSYTKVWPILNIGLRIGVGD
jgi:hypothetical protein